MIDKAGIQDSGLFPSLLETKSREEGSGSPFSRKVLL
jgi:hypothetical protein